jgi:hypothetical protein
VETPDATRIIQVLKMNKLFLNIIFLYFSCSCSHNNKDTDKQSEYLKGEVRELIIEHLVQKANGCRATKISFIIYLKNTSINTINLKNLQTIDACDRKIEKTEIFLSLDKSFKKPKFWEYFHTSNNFCKLAMSSKNPIKLAPLEQTTQKCYILNRIFGSSLKIIYKNYFDMFNLNFKIIIINKTQKIEFTKSKNFKVVFKLDDSYVDSRDSTKLNTQSFQPPTMFPPTVLRLL